MAHLALDILESEGVALEVAQMIEESALSADEIEQLEAQIPHIHILLAPPLTITRDQVDDMPRGWTRGL